MKISAHISFISGMFLLLVSLVSCTEDRDDRPNCLSYETAYVTAAEAPSSVQVGKEVEVQLEFQVHNGCGQFHQFLETETEIGRTIEIEAKYEGCMCTQDIPILEIPYHFIPKTPGEHTLMFLSGEEEYEKIVILVEDNES